MICKQAYYKVRRTTIFILVQINNSGLPKKFLLKFESCVLVYFVVLFFSSDQNEVDKCSWLTEVLYIIQIVVRPKGIGSNLSKGQLFD